MHEALYYEINELYSGIASLQSQVNVLTAKTKENQDRIFQLAADIKDIVRITEKLAGVFEKHVGYCKHELELVENPEGCDENDK